MMRFNIFLSIFLMFFSLAVNGNPLPQGWDFSGSNPTLFLKGKKVHQIGESLSSLPAGLNREEVIEFSLMVSEYYIQKLDKEKVSELLALLKQEEKDYALLESLIGFFWRQEKSEYSESESKLKDYIRSEKDPLYSAIAEKLYFFLQKKPPKNAKITYDDLKSLNCSRTKGYYSLCRVLKLRTHLEYIQESKIDTVNEYSNLDRLLAPFFEEEELQYLPYLEKVFPDSGAKLTYLGLAFEGAHFQEILIKSEKLTGRFDTTSYEKLSFYQMVSGNFTGAEEALNTALKGIRSVNVLKNGILLKLGMLNYVKKDYKKALEYLVQLNFKYWGRTLKNPITDDQITINGARDLLALALWKGRSAAVAVKALGELKTTKPNEEDLFMRLRIAHIMFKDRPKATEKMTEDIIYTAQGKGWRRVEYAATLLNGYTNIINKKHRKSVIQFTKSYGILGNSDPSYTSEWVRQSGMLQARIAGRERGNHAPSFMKLINSMNNLEPNTHLLGVRFFLDQRYGPDEFLKQGINYFISTKNYEYLLTTLYYNSLWEGKPDSLIGQGELQVVEVGRKLNLYKGFRPAIDNVYFKGTLSSIRDKYISHSKKETDHFDVNVLKKASLPAIIIIPFQEQYFAMGYEPESKKWTLQIFNATEFKTDTYYKRLLSSFGFLEKFSSYQIFLNPAGLDLYQYLARRRLGGNGYLFFGFNKDSRLANSEPVGVDCGSRDGKLSSVNYFSMEHFEGSRAMDISKRLLIWNFYEATNRRVQNPLETYQWKCASGEVLDFKRLRRRMDSKTIPTAILFSNPLLHNNSPHLLSPEFYPWVDFWFRKGVSQVVYMDKILNDSQTEAAIKLLTDGSSIPQEWTRLQTLWKGSDREGIILWRDPR
jgi:hypothetical protein